MARSIISLGFALLLMSTAAAQAPAPNQATPPQPTEIVPPTQHTQDINSVVFSLDGEDRFVASTGHDGVVKLWDVATGRLIRNVARIDPNHKFWVLAAVSSDGRRVFGRVGGGVKLWDTITGKEILDVQEVHGPATLFFSKNGTHVAILGDDKTLRVFDGITGKELPKLKNVTEADTAQDAGPFTAVVAGKMVELWKEPTIGVDTLADAPDPVSATGSKHYIEAEDHTLHLKESKDGSELRTFAGQDSVSASIFSLDGSKVAVAAPEKIAVLDAQSGQRIGTCPSPSETIIAVVFSPDGNRLSYGGEDQRVTLCDIASGRTVRAYDKLDATVRSVGFSADGGRLASGDEKGNVRIWEVESGKLLRTFKGNDRSADSVAFTPDGKTLLAGTDDNKVRIWNLATGRETKTLRMLVGPVTAMALAPDGRRVGAGPYCCLMMKQWDIESGKELRKLETPYVGRFWGVTDIRYSTAGDHLAAAAGNNYIVTWDADSGQKKLEISYRDQDVKSIAFSSDGTRLISVDQAGVIRHWDKKTGALLVTVVPFGNGEWLEVTPEGFFDASPDGAKYLTVVRGLDVYSIDQFFNQLHRPDLVHEKLSGDPKGKVRDATAKLDLTKVVSSGNAPEVKIAVAPASNTPQSGQATVTATVTDQGGGIGRIEWRMNGQTVGVEDRGIAPGEPARPADTAPPGDSRRSLTLDNPATATLTRTRTLPLASGDNVIEVLAYNAQNLVASVPAQVVVTSKEAAANSTRPRLYVLSIGVNDYLDSRLKLNFAASDATSISDAFNKAGRGLYDMVKVANVLDKDVTRDHLDQIFAKLGSEIRPTDVFVLFVAGHGRTKDGHYYFIPYDFRYQNEGSYALGGLSQEQWQKWASEIQAKKSVLIFDTCESGSLTADSAKSRDLAFIEEQSTAIEKLKRATGRTVMVAASETEPALEGYRGHGVFTYAVMEGLGKAPVDKEGLIELFELINYVDAQVPELSYQAFKQRQFPQTKFAGSNFPLAKPVVIDADGSASQSTFPGTPTHVVISQAQVRQEANARSAAMGELGPGTLVRLIETSGGWMLVARDGKRVGYIEAASKALAPLK